VFVTVRDVMIVTVWDLVRATFGNVVIAQSWGVYSQEY